MKKVFNRNVNHLIITIALGCLLSGNFYGQCLGMGWIPASNEEEKRTLGPSCGLFDFVLNPEAQNLDSTASKKFLLFLIDFESLWCFPCLDAFLKFYRLLPLRFQKDLSWGVLVQKIQRNKDRGEKSLKIAKKKLRGFIKANKIKFPIVLDRLHIFEDLIEEGTTLLLFDQSQKTVKKFVFPLSRRQQEEIFSLLKEKD